MTAAATGVERWRALFRRHERELAAVWLLGAAVAILMIAVGPVRGRALSLLQATVNQWEARWDRRLAAGAAMVERGDHAGATVYLERLDAAFPARNVRHARDQQREQLLRLLARSYEALGRKGRAMATWDRLVAFDSLNYRNHFDRAQAAERLLSGWALAPEARDGYAGALHLHPNHLPSVRGYVDYYMDRGEFGPVVRAYQDYLDAFLVQRLVVRLGSDSAEVPLPADGRSHDVTVPLSAAGGQAVELSIATGGFAVRLERVALLPAATVGTLVPLTPVALPPHPAALESLEFTSEGALLPSGRQPVARFTAPPLERPVTGVELRVRLYKPVDAPLWQLVGKAYRNLLDETGLRAASERTVVFATPEDADRATDAQGWAREGIGGALDDQP